MTTAMQEAHAFVGLKNINDVEPLDPDGKHAALAADFIAFLERWDAFNWLGLTILHTHHPFMVMEDEMLVEETDLDNRVQIFRPRKIADLVASKQPPIQTTFRFVADGSCKPQTFCHPSPNGHDL